MYNEKALNLVQAWLPGFSAIYHYTKFGMASHDRPPGYHTSDIDLSLISKCTKSRKPSTLSQIISITVRPRTTVGNENPLNYGKIDRDHRMTTNSHRHLVLGFN